MYSRIGSAPASAGRRSCLVVAMLLVAVLGLGACADAPAPEAASAVPETGAADMTGMYTYMADAAVFEDCATGERFPVLIEAAHIDVERAYLEAREAPGAPLLLAARFEVVERAPEPGMPVRQHLRVVGFEEFRPGGVCPPSN